MSQTYEHHLQTGSGWTRVTFHLEEHDAVIIFDRQWMGSDPVRYKLNWIHKKISNHYGLLTLRSVEQFTSIDSDETVVVDMSKFGYYEDDYDSQLPEHVKEITYEVSSKKRGVGIAWLPSRRIGIEGV